MKKNLLFAALAITALASCTSDDFVGDQSPQVLNEDGAITFVSGTPAQTRAVGKTGAAAAEDLNYAFVVGGFKGSTSVASTIVFDNYNVVYPKTASTSNTTGWEYVGLRPNANATIAHGESDEQTIKYWDYSQDQYDFIAYSLGNGGATATAITQATATTTTIPEGKSTAGAYTISGTTAQLSTVHIANLVTVKKASYSNAVTIPFRNLLAKVRIGLYETIPGYSISDVKFYTAADAATPSATSALYAGSSTLPTQGTYTVYFPTVNSEASYNNEAHVAFSNSTTPASYLEFGTITGNYAAAAEKHEGGGSVYLGRQSNQCTWTKTADNHYTSVLPYEEGTALTLKVDYTLLSVDGTGETITVKGATAVIPAIFAQWKPNYAYTYIFKISDNTNGKTDAAQTVEGLHPITFDACEVTSETDVQETVTTVATPSITTYQHDPAANASANNEYKAGTVYAMVMDGGTLKTDLNGVTGEGAKDAAKLFTLSAAATEAEVMDALNMYTDLTEGTYTGLNGLVLTKNDNIDNAIADEDIPGPDGKIIEVADGAASKLTVTSSSGTTYYAYVYTVTQATTTTENNYRPISTEGLSDVNGYYTYDGSSYTQISTTTSPVSGTTYYAKYAQTNQVYAVKVIKVVPAT